jgi:glycerate dehydrogenase
MNAPERLGTPRPLIVVADGFTANPGDLSWGGLAALGELTVHERCGRELLLARCKGAEIVLTNKELFDRATLAALPKLRFISVLATGTNVVDLGAAREQGVVVSNVPAYSTASVAEHTFALLFALNNRIAEHNLAARDGRWSQSGHFSFPQGPIAELHGQSFGIVGFGTLYLLRVRQEEELMLKGFGAEYQAYMDRTGRIIPKLS